VRRPGGTFGIPAALAAATLLALIVGLLDDGVMDAFSWLGLALPLFALVPAGSKLLEAKRRKVSKHSTRA